MAKAGRIVEFDFIRAFSAFIIIAYHFSCQLLAFPNESWAPFRLFYTFTNGGWGDVAVVLFFILSGALLYHRHNRLQRKQVLSFYRGRLMTILPSFWLIWGYLYLQRALEQKDWFYAAAPWKLLLSFAGVDGYFLYKGPNFYFVGEWFLGAILLCYIFCPLLLTVIERFELPVTVIFAASFAYVASGRFFEISPLRNLLTCLFFMWIGMVLTKHMSYVFKRTGVTVVSFLIILLLSVWRVPTNTIIPETIFSIALFVFLWNCSGLLMKSSLVSSVVSSTGKISFQIFLVHHVLISAEVSRCSGYAMNTIHEILLFVFCLIQIYVFAYLLYHLTYVVNSFIVKRNCGKAEVQTVKHQTKETAST